MQRLAALVALSLLAASPARAAEGAHPAKAAPSGFELRPVATPVVVDGQVVNYVFVTVRLTPAAPGDVNLLRDKEPFFRDALVRASHRTPFTVAGDYNRIDEARAVAAVMAVAPAIAGKGKVRSAVVSKQQPRNLLRAPAAAPAAPAREIQ